jgi:hypothetical protein
VLRVGKGTAPVKLHDGDVAIVCHGEAHSIRDSVGSPAAPIGDLLATAGSSKLVRIGGAGPTTLVCGCFYSEALDMPPMFALLPPVLHIQARHAPSAWALIDLLATEARLGTEGSGAVSARLSEASSCVFDHARTSTMKSEASLTKAFTARMRKPWRVPARIGGRRAPLARRPEGLGRREPHRERIAVAVTSISPVSGT